MTLSDTTNYYFSRPHRFPRKYKSAETFWRSLVLLPIAFRQAVLLTLSPVKGVTGVICPCVRRAGREADYCRASSTEEKERLSLFHTFSWRQWITVPWSLPLTYPM